MADKLNFSTWNVQGLRSILKRKTIFRLLKAENFSFVALQETYLSQEDLRVLEKEWNGTFHLSGGTTRSKGLITLFSNQYKD